MDVRLFTENDYNEVIKLWKRTGLILSLSDEKEELLKLAKHNPESFFLLTDGNKIVGAVAATWDGRRGYINRLAIDPSLQNQGLGKMLMQKAMEFYGNKGAVKVHLMVEKSNIKVVDYYKKQNWEIRDDLVLMTKTLRKE